MKVGVLALQGAVDRHARCLVRLGAEPVEIRRAEQLEGVDALILPGGESTTTSRLLETSGLVDPLADRLADGMPALGTCAGMILLGREIVDGRPDQRCFGAIDLVVRRNGYGRQLASFEADVAVDGIDGGPVPAVFIRAPVAEHAGPGVEMLARHDGHPVVCRQGPVLVTAFHPELADDLRLHELFLHHTRGAQ